MNTQGLRQKTKAVKMVGSLLQQRFNTKKERQEQKASLEYLDECLINFE